MIKVKKFKLSGWGKVSENQINRFIDSVDILEFQSEGGAVSEPFLITPDGKHMILKYLEKGDTTSDEYHIERLKLQIQSLRARQIQTKLNLAHAAAVEKGHRGGQMKLNQAAENLAKCETDAMNVDFELKSKIQILSDLSLYGLDELGTISSPENNPHQ